MIYYALWLLLIFSIWPIAPASAQPAGGHAAAGILNALPPDVYAKLQKLSLLIDQNIKAGKITDAQIQAELMSGHLEQTIRSLGPEATQLMDEITNDIRNGKGPGEEALVPLLGGLSEIGR